MIVALIGNQNSGKTTLFNRLTGSNQKVGNFPGVTVSKKQAPFKLDKSFTVVDLPGIYSLSPYSAEEVVTRDFLLDEKPDVILNVLDTTNIERSLYLSLQLIELGIPMVIALNMMDEMAAKGAHVHLDKLVEELGVPVMPISASRNEGVNELMQTLVEVAKNKQVPKNPDLCSGPTHRAIHTMMVYIDEHAKKAGMSPRFAATKICERDSLIQDRLHLNENEQATCEHMIQDLEAAGGLDNLAALAKMRYDFIDEVCAKAIHKGMNDRDPGTVALDKVLTHKIWAIPIFFALLALVFWLSFSGPGGLLAEEFNVLLGNFTDRIDLSLINTDISPLIRSFIVEGFLSGLASVLSFLPLIIILFFLLSVLEDSGYMARVAFVMDSAFRRIGLSGASIVPLIMGFGCSVPAFMATRTLPGRRDRIITTFLIPFMSCSAKVPIYGAITAVFFGRSAGLVMISLYLLGILLALITGLIIKLFSNEVEPMPFMMELPPYRFPDAKSVMRNLWEKVKDFLSRAFTVILLVTIVVWFLRSFDGNLCFVTDVNTSILANLSRVISPVFQPMGINDWRAPAALISGLTAKEAVISTLSVLSGVGISNLGSILQEMFTPLSAYTFLIFVLIYTPCVAAVASAKRELGSWPAAIGMAAGQTVLAWILSVLIYQIGKLFIASTWFAFAVCLFFAILFVVLLRLAQQKKDRNKTDV